MEWSGVLKKAGVEWSGVLFQIFLEFGVEWSFRKNQNGVWSFKKVGAFSTLYITRQCNNDQQSLRGMSF